MKIGPDKPKGIINWQDGDKRKSIRIIKDRTVIGTTQSSDICLANTKKPMIAMVIESQENALIATCLSDEIPIRIKGSRMNKGESLAIASNVNFVIGHQRFSIEKSLPFPQMEEKKDQHRLSNLDLIISDLSTLLVRQLNYYKRSKEENDFIVSREKAESILNQIIFDQDTFTQADLSIKKMDLISRVLDEVLGLGPLEPLLEDQKISEIMVNSHHQIYIERQGKIRKSEVTFSSKQALLSAIERIVAKAGRRIDTLSPIVDARLQDGSRVNAVIPPIALKGPSLTIRRFSKDPISMEKLLELGSLSQTMAHFLRISVESKFNILVSGGTGSGKTSLLNALSSYIPHDERVITVEDAAELQLQQPHVVSLEARPENIEGKGSISIRQLVKNCLRMRPDRIIVGECRGGETLDMLQAMNTGHEGSMTTGHGNSPLAMLRRLETMVLMTGIDFPLKAIREQIASAIHLIIQQTRFPSGRRCITEIQWLKGLNDDSGEYDTRTLFSLSSSVDNMAASHQPNRDHLDEFINSADGKNGFKKLYFKRS